MDQFEKVFMLCRERARFIDAMAYFGQCLGIFRELGLPL